MAASSPAARWALFAIISAIFFLINGATFSSLGVVLPFMIKELSWSWSQAGTGFSLFALTVGLASTVPAWILRRFGIKATYGVGGAVMACGFALLALTSSLQLYLVAMPLLGLGFASCATVPGVFLLNGWMPEKRSATIGAYMTIGGLGAVAGPLASSGVIAATGSWRFYWWAVTTAMLALTTLAVAIVKSPPDAVSAAAETAAPSEEPRSAGVYRTTADWRFRDAVRTTQFWTIAIAMTTMLLCVLTTNGWAVTHMGTLGVPAAVAAGVLSADGAVNALSRAVGGVLATRIDPKHLLVAALLSEAIGVAALSVADNWIAFTVFAVADGFGFGMCFFATAMLLVNYFGPSENPEILGTYNLVTTLAMIGPATAGFVADAVGGFSRVFMGYAAVVLVVVAITAAMRPPS
ncbi:MAG: CynX/NimT family MFS transporter, partial [Steroidobacteraceae bacterium]